MKKYIIILMLAIILGGLLMGGQCPTTPPSPSPTSTTEETQTPEPTPLAISIIIESGKEKTNDETPVITLSASNAYYMAFSGNGISWTPWIHYSTSYSGFNLNSSAGCTDGDGLKIVYVKFKNKEGKESNIISDSIILDTTKPYLSGVSWTDVNGNGEIDENDILVFTFNEAMDTSTITSATVDERFTLSGGASFGSSVSWDSTSTICSVTLGSGETISGGETVSPTSKVKDVAGNGCDTTIAKTIPTPTHGTTYIESAAFTDNGIKGTVDTDDIIIVTFNNPISIITLSSTASDDFGLYNAAGTAFSWTKGTSAFVDTAYKVVRIKIGQTIQGATTTTLKSIGVLANALKDKWGNYVSTIKKSITYLTQ